VPPADTSKARLPIVNYGILAPLDQNRSGQDRTSPVKM
jgi:hypothetical protein